MRLSNLRRRENTIVGRNYSIRVTVYKAILDLKSFPLGFEAQFTRWGTPKVSIGMQESVIELEKNLSGVREPPGKSQIRVGNPFFLPSALRDLSYKKEDVPEEVSNVDKFPISYGIDSVDMRFCGKVTPPEHGSFPIQLNINLAYEHSTFSEKPRLFGAVAEINLENFLGIWRRKEREWNFKHQTSINDLAPWFDFQEFVVPIMKVDDMPESFPELMNFVDLDKTMLEGRISGKFKNNLGKLFVRIDVLNSAQENAEGPTIEPPIQVEATIEEVMNGAFGQELTEHFVELYQPSSDTHLMSRLLIPRYPLMKMVRDVRMICPPSAFMLLLDLACAYSDNPIEMAFDAMKVVKKRAKKADRQTKVKWEEIYEETEGRVITFLDQITNLPSTMAEKKLQILEVVPKMAVKLGSTKSMGHPIMLDHLEERWHRRKPIQFFGKKCSCFPEGSCFEVFTSPSVLFYGHLIAYLIFTMTMVLPFFSSDNSYFYSVYVANQLLNGNGNGQTSFINIEDNVTFWNWAIDVLAESIYIPTNYILPIGSIYIRQFRVIETPCNVSVRIYNKDGNDTVATNQTRFLSCYPDLVDENSWQTDPTWHDLNWEDSSGAGIPIQLSTFYPPGLPAGGYVKELSYAMMKEDLQLLQSTDWFDDQTRAIILEIPVFNANDQIYCLIVCLVEISSVGMVRPSVQYYFVSQSELSNHLFPNSKEDNDSDYGGLVIFFMVIGYLLQEIREILNSRLKDYFRDFWNILDIIFFLGTLATYCIKFVFPGTISPSNVKLGDLVHWTSLVTTRQMAYGFFTLWAFLRLMVYLRRLKATAPLIVALNNMLQKDIFNFILLSALILMGWSVVMTQLLKGSTFEYRSIEASMGTLLRSGLGAFSYVDTGNGGNSFNENFANIMLALYSLLVLILLINLLIAMMGNSYENVQEEAVNHWGFALAQSLLYYEQGFWIPPFNIISEGVSLIIWLLNLLTCGIVKEKTGIDDEFPLKTWKSKTKSEESIESDYKFSEVVQKIISPEASVREWIEITDDGNVQEPEGPTMAQKTYSRQAQKTYSKQAQKTYSQRNRY